MSLGVAVLYRHPQVLTLGSFRRCQTTRCGDLEGLRSSEPLVDLHLGVEGPIFDAIVEVVLVLDAEAVLGGSEYLEAYSEGGFEYVE